ncbi:MAG: DUF6476 family protein [Acidiphilium sp.]|nr:DUF6476 family protein [Acidiphilium sp.]
MDQTRDSRKGTPDLRGLKALVIGLGVLILLGTALVIGVVVKRFMESTGHAPVSIASGAPFATVLPGGSGSKIAGIAGAGGEVAVWIDDGKGGRIDFIDPRSGAVLGSARVR